MSRLFVQSSSLKVTTSAAVLLVIVQPFLWSYVHATAKNLHSQQKNREQLALGTQKITESEASLVAAKSRMLKLSESFGAPSDISQLVGRLEALADSKRLAIELQSIEDGAPIEAGSISLATKVITAKVTGSTKELFSFLEAMEHQKEFLTVESWNVALSGAIEPPVFTMTLSIMYYFYANPS